MVEVVRSFAALRPHEQAWQELAAHAVEPNVFHEPWQLLPAIEMFGHAKTSVFVLVHGLVSGPQPRRQLIGFFPFELTHGLRRFPARILTAWQHPHLTLSTPLVHADFATEAWRKLLAWASSSPSKATLLEFPHLLCEGPSYWAVLDTVNAAGLVSTTVEHYTRACLFRSDCGTEAALDGLSSGARKELRRQRRRLAEKGRLELRQLAHGEDPQGWIEQFEALEASGWKGTTGTALASRGADARWFEQVCRSGHTRGQLQMMGLFLDDRPIAMKCNFLGSKVAFTLKIAYDEAYKAYSPGMLLELDHLETAFQSDLIERIDSCAIPNHNMINRLWRGRRIIADLAISTGSVKGNLQIGSYCLFRSLKRSLTSAKPQEARHGNLNASPRSHAIPPAGAAGRRKEVARD